MWEKIVSNWNSTASSKDTIIIIGDFAWRNVRTWLNRLNGKKIMVLGNHDRLSRVDMAQFTEVIGGTRKGAPGILERTIDKTPVCFCHYPLDSWNASCHGSWQLHGHCHGNMPENPDKMQFDVGMDVWDFKIIPWDVIVAKMESKRERCALARRMFDRAAAEKAKQQLIEVNRKWYSKS